MARNLEFSQRPSFTSSRLEWFAPVPFLEHTVGPACFTVRPDHWSKSWKVHFWHGNMGHDLGLAPSREEGFRVAQHHLDTMVTALTDTGGTEPATPREPSSFDGEVPENAYARHQGTISPVQPPTEGGGGEDE